MNSTSFSLFSLVLLFPILASCSSVRGSTQEVLDHNKKKWQQQGIASYQYTFQRSCFCPEELTREVRIAVREGILKGVRYAKTAEALMPSSYQHFKTIPELFDFIQDAINQKAEIIEVMYNDDYGFPSSVRIDYSTQAADEELQFVAHSLTPER